MALEDEPLEGSSDSTSDYDAEESDEDTSTEEGEDDNDDVGTKCHVGSHNGTQTPIRGVEKEMQVKHATQHKQMEVFTSGRFVEVLIIAVEVWFCL